MRHAIGHLFYMNNMHIALGAVSVAITKALLEMCDRDVLAL